MTMRELETQGTSSPHVNLTAYVQLRDELEDQTVLSKDFGALCDPKRWCISKPQPEPKREHDTGRVNVE